MAKKKRILSGIGVYTVSITLLLAIVFLRGPKVLPLEPLTGENVFSLLATLFIISLFIERAVEIYITVDRSSGAAEKDWNIEALKRRIEANPPKKERLELEAKLEGLQKERIAYRIQTTQKSMYFAATLGFLISAMGIRCLDPLLASGIFKSAESWQRVGFDLVDVILTAGLLAGGSEGINKITMTLTAYTVPYRNRIAPDPPNP